MIFFIRRVVIVAVLILPMNTLLADNYPPELICTAQLSNEDLVGVYSLIMGPGLVSMEGMTMPFPETPKSPVKVFLLNDELVISADDGHFDMTLSKVGNNEAPWKFSNRKIFKSLDSDDLGLALGCKTTDLPRYSGKGWFMTEDNVKAPSTMKLIVHGISDAGIDAIGVMNSSAQGISFKVRMSLKGGDLIKLKSTINKKSKMDNSEKSVDKGKPPHGKNNNLN